MGVSLRSWSVGVRSEIEEKKPTENMPLWATEGQYPEDL